MRGSGWLYNHDKEITISERNKAIDDFTEWLVNHKIVDKDSMPEIIIDFNEEQLNESKGKRRVKQNVEM